MRATARIGIVAGSVRDCAPKDSNRAWSAGTPDIQWEIETIRWRRSRSARSGAFTV